MNPFRILIGISVFAVIVGQKNSPVNSNNKSGRDNCSWFLCKNGDESVAICRFSGIPARTFVLLNEDGRWVWIDIHQLFEVRGQLFDRELGEKLRLGTFVYVNDEIDNFPFAHE